MSRGSGRREERVFYGAAGQAVRANVLGNVTRRSGLARSAARFTDQGMLTGCPSLGSWRRWSVKLMLLTVGKFVYASFGSESMLCERNRTEPSPNTKFTPPVCLLL